MTPMNLPVLLVVLIALALPSIIHSADPQWCQTAKTFQKGSLFSHCSTHDVNNANDALPKVASWCSKTNFRASTRISLRDPDFQNSCTEPGARCLEVPTMGATPSCQWDPEQDFAYAAATPIAGHVPPYNYNFTQRCSTATYSVPFEMTQGNNPKRKLLAIASHDAVIIMDMATEKVVREMPLDKNAGVFQIVKVLSRGANALIVGAGSSSLSHFYVTLKPSSEIAVSQLVTVQTNRGVLDMDAFTDSSNNHWVVVLTNSGASQLSLLFYNLKGTPTDFNLPTNTYQLTDAPVSLFYKISTFSHHELNRAAVLNSVACIPSKTERWLVILYTQRQAYIFAHYPQLIDVETTSINVDDAKGKSLFWLSDGTTELTSATAFGECFGDTSTPSQSVWLVLGTRWNQNGVMSYAVRYIPLVEFAQVIFTCASGAAKKAWKQPSVYTDPDCPAPITTPCTGAPATFRMGGTCKDRIIVNDQPVQSLVTQLIVKLFTSTSSQPEPEELEYSFVQHVFAVQPKSIDILSFQELACSQLTNANLPRLDRYQTFTFPNYVRSITVSDNAQHLFVSVYKREWELLNQQRLVDICKMITQNPSSLTYLSRFQTICTSQNPRPLSVLDFVKYYSQCNDKWYCPDFGKNQQTITYQVVNPGSHTIRPTSYWPCEPGFFCPSLTSGRRKKCPIGFKCPLQNMRIPTPCQVGVGYETSCPLEGQTTETSCPVGFICNTPRGIIPAPPGFNVKNANRKTLYQCKLGDFCSLGTGSENSTNQPLDISCPFGAYCPSPSIMAPTNCSAFVGTGKTMYCNSRTFEVDLCPAGYECPTPTTKKPCVEGFYCPNGTSIASVCPAGYYCSDPSTIQECPYGYYCIEGSSAPIKCQYLVICGPRTTKPYYAFGAILLDVALITVVGIAFLIIRLIQRDIRKKREKKRQEKEKSRLLSDSYVSSVGANIASVILGAQDTGNLTLAKKKYTMEIEMQDLSYIRRKTKKIVFAGVSGKLKPGKVTCVLCDDLSIGKALLQTLCGRSWEGHIDGTIKVNGAVERMANFSNIIGYVPENIKLHDEFKVKELLRFSAHQRLPGSTSFWQISRKVQQTLDVFNLQDYADTQINRLKKFGFDSVQRKLVNIAVEVVAEPTALFLENPLAGIDTINSRRVIRVLKDVAESGVTVVCLAYKPSFEIFKLFDEVLFVSSKAGMVYNGPSSATLQYFEEIGFRVPKLVNPVDYFVDICQGTVNRTKDSSFKPEKLMHYWEIKKQEKNKPWGESYEEALTSTSTSLEGGEFGNYVAPVIVDTELSIDGEQRERERKRQGLGCIGQFFLFTVRSFLEHAYHIKGWIFDLMFTFIVASIIGAFFFNLEFVGPMSPSLQSQCPPLVRDKCALPRKDNVPMLMLVTSVALAVSAVYTSVKPFGAYKALFKQESQSVNKLSYMLGKMVSQIPYLLFLPFIFLSVWYLLVAPRVNIFVYYGIFLLLWNMWAGFGYWISLALQRQHAMFFSIVIIVASCFISGYQPSLTFMESNWYTWPLVQFSPMRWAVELLYTIELRSYGSDGVNIQTALSQFGYSESHIGASVGIMLAYVVLFRLLAYLALVFADPVIMEKIRTVLGILKYKGRDRLKKLKEIRRKKATRKDSVMANAPLVSPQTAPPK